MNYQPSPKPAEQAATAKIMDADYRLDQAHCIRTSNELRKDDHARLVAENLIIIEARRLNKYRNTAGYYEDTF